MTQLAVLAETAAVSIILLVAGVTIGGGGGKLAFEMAIHALGVSVAPGEQVTCFIMVEAYVLPVGRVMTFGAILTGSSQVPVILSVAGVAVVRGAVIEVIDVAVRASDINVAFGKLIVGQVVVKTHLLPVITIMATSAIQAGVALMLVILSVAGIAVYRCVQVNIVDVTVNAGSFNVFSDQSVFCIVMVYNRLRPALGVVAFGAIFAHSGLVFVLFCVA